MPVLAAMILLFAGTTNPVISVIDSYPSLSPDGTTLQFQSNRTGRNAIYLADADGSNLRMLYEKNDPETPAWSADGERIAFVALVDGQTEIFVMDADGDNVERLTNHPGDDAHPHWSRDGRIFFNSARTTPDPAADWSAQYHEIFSMKADGSDLRQHTRCRSVCTFGSLSSNGKRLVYRKVIDGRGRRWDQSEDERNSEVFVAAIDGENEINLSRSEAFDGWPVWTLDSRHVVFASNRGGRPFIGEIYAADPDTGAIVQLTDDEWSNVQPSVTPDGDAIFTYRNFETADYEFGHIARTPVSLP